MRIMGIDYGDARTGIAVSDPQQTLASPVCVIHEWNTEALVNKTAALAKEQSVEQIVVGLPRNMNGTYGPRAQKAREFAGMLEKATGLTVALWDERCTTLSADVYFHATGVRGKKRREVVDAAAATIILQDYLTAARSTSRGSLE